MLVTLFQESINKNNLKIDKYHIFIQISNQKDYLKRKNIGIRLNWRQA